MPKLLLFKAGDQRQCSKICDFLNEFGHNSHKFGANASSNSYYGIHIETLKTCCGSIEYLQSHYPTIEKKIYDTIPTFVKIPVSIQKKLVDNSTSKSPIPFIDDIFADASKGGIDWNRLSSAEYYEIMSAINANTKLEFNTALAADIDLDFKVDTSAKADACTGFITSASAAINDCIMNSHARSIKEAISDYINNKSLNNETELQNKGASFRRDSGEIKGGIRSRVHKPRVAIKSLSYKKVIGRG